MNQIEKQQAVIQSIETEIEAARQRVVSLSQELATLQGATEPDDLSRRAGLVLAVEQGRAALPILPPPLRAEWRPKIQQRLEHEQDELNILRHRAWELSRGVQRLEGIEGAWAGRLPEVQKAWSVIAEMFNKANFHPEGLDAGKLHGLGLVLSNMAKEIDGLPALCQRLAGLGFDGDWRPAGWVDEIENTFAEQRQQNRSE